ncbi:MAG: porin [Deltaproteobacteria bacterium]|nr:porin [Deltaproteobacteria bacterium]
MKIRSLALALVTASPLLALEFGPATAAENAPAATAALPALATEETDSRLRELDERATALEARLRAHEQEASRAKKAAVGTAGEKGFALKSADGAFAVKLRGLLHADGRQFIENEALRPNATFVARRARPILQATFFDVADFRLMPDFGNGNAVVQDAYGDLRPFPWLKLRVGKFKPPVGLERLQSTSAIVFTELALPTMLVPNRDAGVQLHGDIAGGIVSYAAGVFNGVVDGSSGDLDNNFAKDVAGRVFVRPWKTQPASLLSGLGLGFAASSGNRRGKAAVLSTSGSTVTVTTASSPSLPSFKTAGQQKVFSYIVDDKNDATVLAEGRHTRLAPQACFYVGPFGLLGEYVRSTHSVLKGAESAKLDHSAWQVAATFLFGEGKNAYEGVQVAHPVDRSLDKLGVLELALRYNELRIDEAAFPLYADPAKSIKVARGWAAAANWHWSGNVKLGTTYEETYFEGGAAAGGDRATERVLSGRLQMAF